MSITGASVPTWRMSGELLSACNCDWGCPCNFDAPPTYGHCDGFYVLELYLDKPTGFTSTRSELGMSTVGRFRSPSFNVDVSGKYAEHARFSYTGP